jgi:uncharacterized protein (DUF433 family)
MSARKRSIWKRSSAKFWRKGGFPFVTLFFSHAKRDYDEKEGKNMAALDWSQCPAVESIPGKVSGAWVFRDTRLPVATVIENLEDLSVEEVMEQFDVTREQIAAVLNFVAQSLNASAPEQPPVPVDAHSL